MKGGEPFQPVTAKADRSNGYVKGNKGMADVQPKASEMVNYLSLSLSLSLTLSLPPPSPPLPHRLAIRKLLKSTRMS